MRHRNLPLAALAFLTACGVATAPRATPEMDAKPARGLEASAAPASADGIFGSPPVAFEENRGQADGTVRYLARRGAGTLFLTRRSVGFHLGSQEGGATVRLRPAGGLPSEPVPEQPMSGRVNYLVGSDPEGWRTDIATWGAVRYRDLWPATDLLFYGTDGGALEYDLQLAPGADPSRISFRIAGARDLRLTPAGDLVIDTAAGAITQRAPVAFQETGAGRRSVEGTFHLRGRRLGFQIGPYDPDLPLVIDPVIVLDHSSFLGGGGFESGASIVADASGAAYVTGTTDSANFPVTPGAHDAAPAPDDVFVAKVNPAGTALEFSTYLGGGDTDRGEGIALGPSGTSFVAGRTSSGDFPTTPGAHDTILDGANDAFVSHLNAAGTALISSTLLGGGDTDEAHDVTLDPSGAVYVMGDTESGDFPTAGTPFDATYNSPGHEDVFVTKLDPSLTGPIYSTYLGGSHRELPGDNGIAVDASGAAYLTGDTLSVDFPITPGAFNSTHDGGNPFVAKLNPAGSDLVFSTFLSEDDGEGVAVDAAGFVYVTGEADPGFTTTPGAFDETVDGFSDGYIVKLNPAGTSLVYSTVIGGSGFEDVTTSVVVDASGRASIGGQTDSPDFPTTPGAFDPTYQANTDAWVATVSADGSELVASTFLGGGEFDESEDVAIDPFGRLYVSGQTGSSDFPTASFDPTYNGGVDGFVARLGLRCPGKESRPGLHIVGTDAAETLVGSDGRDLICAEGGRDVVRAGPGSDTVLGDKGKDTLKGAKGKDTLKGGNGQDTLNGGTGRDTLRGGKGRDTLRGGKGKDRCAPGPKSGSEISCER